MVTTARMGLGFPVCSAEILPATEEEVYPILIPSPSVTR